jgi:hypothetical protein
MAIMRGSLQWPYRCDWAGADFTVADNDGSNSLLRVVSSGHLEVVELAIANFKVCSFPQPAA